MSQPNTPNKVGGGIDLPASPIWRFPWLADLVFGMFIGMPATLLGIAVGWWEIAAGWRVFFPVVLASLVLLPAYRFAVTSRSAKRFDP